MSKWNKLVSVDETVEAMGVSSFSETFIKKRLTLLLYSWGEFYLG